jgi:hypothetical protein
VCGGPERGSSHWFAVALEEGEGRQGERDRFWPMTNMRDGWLCGEQCEQRSRRVDPDRGWPMCRLAAACENRDDDHLAAAARAGAGQHARLTGGSGLLLLILGAAPSSWRARAMLAARLPLDAGRLAEVSDHLGIDRVGLGALTDGVGEGADLRQVGDRHGQAGPARAATTTVSKPPVASSTMRLAFSTLRRATSSSSPAPVRATTKRSPLGRTATSRRSFETSIPHMVLSMATRPCLIELAVRPRRLFGFDGTAGGEPD